MAVHVRSMAEIMIEPWHYVRRVVDIMIEPWQFMLEAWQGL